MLRFCQVESKIDGFFYNHFTYEDLVKIAEENDIILIDNQEFPEVISEMKSLGFHTDDEKFYILISDKVTNPNSKWYYLGHELGHFFLHRVEDAFYTVDLKKGEITDKRCEHLEVMEAQANLFSKFLFLPLDLVREKAPKYLCSETDTIVEEFVDYILDKLKDPKPTNKVRLTSLVTCIIDSYLIFLGFQNVIYAQNGHMNHIIELVKKIEIFEKPEKLWTSKSRL